MTPKLSGVKPNKQSSRIEDEIESFDIDDESLMMDDNDDEMEIIEKPLVKEKKAKIVEAPAKEKKVVVKKETAPAKKEEVVKEKKTAPAKKEKAQSSNDAFAGLNITFQKPLTDREEKVLAYFVEKRGEIVYAKDLAELLDLKRDYIYKYIKNLRAKMSTDIIVNADNGGFKLD